MAEDADDRDPSRRRIPPEEMEFELRMLRRRIVNIETAQSTAVELLRLNVDATKTLEGRTFGFRDDREGGAIGRLSSTLSGLRRQNWTLIGLVVGALITGLVVVLTR